MSRLGTIHGLRPRGSSRGILISARQMTGFDECRGSLSGAPGESGPSRRWRETDALAPSARVARSGRPTGHSSDPPLAPGPGGRRTRRRSGPGRRPMLRIFQGSEDRFSSSTVSAARKFGDAGERAVPTLSLAVTEGTARSRLRVDFAQGLGGTPREPHALAAREHLVAGWRPRSQSEGGESALLEPHRVQNFAAPTAEIRSSRGMAAGDLWIREPEFDHGGYAMVARRPTRIPLLPWTSASRTSFGDRSASAIVRGSRFRDRLPAWRPSPGHCCMAPGVERCTRTRMGGNRQRRRPGSGPAGRAAGSGRRWRIPVLALGDMQFAPRAGAPAAEHDHANGRRWILISK